MSSPNGSHPKVLNLSLSKIKKSTSSAQTKTTSSFFRDKGKARLDPPPAPKVDAREKEPLKDATAQNGVSIKSEPLDVAMMVDLVKMEAEEPVTPEEDEDMLLKQFQDCLVENRKRSRSQSIESEKPKPEKMARKIQGEDVFCKSSVKTWQKPRIKAWEDRHMNAEGYYFRFVVPGVGQQNGVWSNGEHKLFMDRYNEWISHGWKIGNSWGLFSKSISRRVGYQCMNYYRKLLLERRLKDDDYVVEGGKLKRSPSASTTSGASIPPTDLGAEWETDEVKSIEENVNQWLKEYHGRSGVTALSKPINRTPKAPRMPKSTARRSNISDLVKRMPVRPRVNGEGDHADDMETEAEIAHLQSRDLETEWKERLEGYKAFIKPYLDVCVREKLWMLKQKWREGLSTTRMRIDKQLVIKQSAVDVKKPKGKPQPVQSLLSTYFTGVKALKKDTPDELISMTRIPNDLYYGVKRIKPLSLIKSTAIEEQKTYYKQLGKMEECLPILDEMLVKESDAPGQSSLEGILMDPPWEYYVADGKNDGRCSYNITDFKNLMEKLIKHMSAGIIFVWVHKLIQGDIIRLMYELDCKYVENLVWFKKSSNNNALDQPSPYMASTKDILLLFKKGDAIDLRHQRSPDVVIDFEVEPDYWVHEEYTEPKPRMVYDMIQTMLPGGAYNESLKRGKLLELWAKKNSPRREGWIAFHQVKDSFHMETE